MKNTTVILAVVTLAGIVGGGMWLYAARSHKTPRPPAASINDFVILTRDGCVNTPVLRANLEQALHTLQMPDQYAVIDQGTLPLSDPRRGYATPTLLRNNRDIFGMAQPTPPFAAPT
jgi:hypothetical protein